jgi:hypothetical protein
MDVYSNIISTISIIIDICNIIYTIIIIIIFIITILLFLSSSSLLSLLSSSSLLSFSFHLRSMFFILLDWILFLAYLNIFED